MLLHQAVYPQNKRRTDGRFAMKFDEISPSGDYQTNLRRHCLQNALCHYWLMSVIERCLGKRDEYPTYGSAVLGRFVIKVWFTTSAARSALLMIGSNRCIIAGKEGFPIQVLGLLIYLPNSVVQFQVFVWTADREQVVFVVVDFPPCASSTLGVLCSSNF